MNIDIKDVDIAILSHGHVDHGGALSIFLEQNDKANVYVQNDAFNLHYNKIIGLKIPIGIDSTIKNSPRIKSIKDFYEIEKGMVLFSSISEKDYYPTSNKTLYEKKNGKIMQDNFLHEQYLIIA